MNIEYENDGKRAVFNGESFTRDDKTGYYLTTNNTNRPGRRLHRAVWEYYNGEIPNGFDIHHIDHDKSNNDISNLALLKRSEHQKVHATESTEESKEKKRTNLAVNARPLANKWHRSENGREWHKVHYEHMKDKMHKKVVCVCVYCGAEYVTEYQNRNKYCSNKCKSAYRRNKGLDKVERTCIVCGKPFSTNKYRKTKTCTPLCASVLRRGNSA